MIDTKEENKFGTAMQSLYDLALHVDASTNEKTNMIKEQMIRKITEWHDYHKTSYEDILCGIYLAAYEELNRAKKCIENK